MTPDYHMDTTLPCWSSGILNFSDHKASEATAHNLRCLKTCSKTCEVQPQFQIKKPCDKGYMKLANGN